MKKSLIWIIACLLGCSAVAQDDPVLMRINGKDVYRSEFEFFLKTNNEPGLQKSGKLHAYLESFTDDRLKLAAAEAAGMDTLQAFRDKLARYRQQLIRFYLTDKTTEETDIRRIYENLKKNNPAGEVQVMHVFKYLPQNVTPHHLQQVQMQMDSIYAALSKLPRPDFSEYVQRYSDEKDTFWVGKLQTSTEFEEIVFSLKNGEFSKPFFTPRGLHIVKVIGRRGLLSYEDTRNKLEDLLSRQYATDKGMSVQVERLKKDYKYIPDEAGVEELFLNGATSRKLFSLDNRSYTGNEFRRFAQSHPLGIEKQFEAFVTKSVLDYANGQLEQTHPEFRLQLKRYRDEALLAAISRREGQRQNVMDTTGLKSYFKTHQSDYNWPEPRFEGAVLHATSKKIGKQARKLLKKLPETEWKDALRLTFNASSPAEVVLIEQGIFAEGDNKFIDRLVFKKGKFDPIKSNPFTVVVGEKRKGPKSYKEVLDLLLRDYKTYLDALWTERLRAAGKVEINQEVLKTVNNH